MYFKCYYTVGKKNTYQKTYKNLNGAEFKPASPGNRPSALTTKLYVLIKLHRNSYTFITSQSV